MSLDNKLVNIIPKLIKEYEPAADTVFSVEQPLGPNARKLIVDGRVVYVKEGRKYIYIAYREPWFVSQGRNYWLVWKLDKNTLGVIEGNQLKSLKKKYGENINVKRALSMVW